MKTRPGRPGTGLAVGNSGDDDAVRDDGEARGFGVVLARGFELEEPAQREDGVGALTVTGCPGVVTSEVVIDTLAGGGVSSSLKTCRWTKRTGAVAT